MSGEIPLARLGLLVPDPRRHCGGNVVRSMRQKIVEMVVSGFTAAGLSYGFGTLMQSVFGLGVEG